MKTEKELLEIAKEVIQKNKNICAKLTGSLMLYHRDIITRRKSVDIDIICNVLGEERNSEGFPWVPEGFKLNDMNGSRSEVEVIQFINEDGLKIEFMLSEEMGEIVDGIPCGDVKELVFAKLTYSRNDKNEESRLKHLDDVIYLLSNNHDLQIC